MVSQMHQTLSVMDVALSSQTASIATCLMQQVIIEGPFLLTKGKLLEKQADAFLGSELQNLT